MIGDLDRTWTSASTRKLKVRPAPFSVGPSVARRTSRSRFGDLIAAG